MSNFFMYDNYKFPLENNWWFVELEDTGDIFDRPTKHCGEWFSDEEAVKVEGITIFINESSFDSSNDVFLPLRHLSKFNNLKFLDIPADAIEHIDFESIRHILKYLRISNPRSDENRKAGINKKLMLFETTLLNLTSLSMYNDPTCYQNFDMEHFPKLQWLDVNLELDKTAKSLKPFYNLKSIQGFCLTGIYKKDLLNDLSRSIIAIELWDIRTKALNLNYLTEFKKLKYIRINAKVDLDCKILASLPELTELELWNVKSQNMSALLESNSLKKLSIQTSQKLSPISDRTIEQMREKFAVFKYW